MKTITILILAIILIAGISCGQQSPPPVPPTPTAGPTTDLCITVVSIDYDRIREAFGVALNLKDENGQPRPATAADVESAMLHYVEGTTHDYERRKNMEHFSPPPLGGQTKDKAAPSVSVTPTLTPRK